jgi:2-dehydro-3-deoxygalactonokinase
MSHGRPSTAASLIAVDWGTTSCRAYLVSAAGDVLDTRSTAAGVSRATGTPGGEARTEWFAAAFEGLCGRWLDEHGSLPVLACGMVGSSQGWVETPYRPLPVDLLEAGDLTVASSRRGDVHIVPGIVKRHGLAGVIRGEETQVAAVLEAADRADLVLPGTHSKWVRTHGSVVTDFTTFMTGEVYGLLVGGSILGALAERPAAPRWEAFDRGVRVAGGPDRWAGPLSTAFSARSLVLTGSLEPADVHDYLSGLMVGSELAAVRTGWLEQPARTLLCVGDAALAERYCRAARLLGWPGTETVSDAAPTGLWRTAVAAGLVPAPQPAPAARLREGLS